MDPCLINYEHPAYTTNCGGGGQVTETLLRGLSRHGHDPELVTDDTDGWYLTSPRRLYRRLRDLADPGLLHAHFSVPSGLPAAYYRLDRDLPLVVSVMGADIYDPTRYDYIAPLRDLANRFVFRQADRVVAPSTDMAKRVRERYGIDAEVINYGIDSDQFHWDASGLHDPIRILTLCRHVERKNLRRACEASQQLADWGWSITHRVVGTGPERARLQREFGDSDVHEFPGYAESKQSQYRWGDVFFLPSLHEAFGMVFLEALASGLPVATSDVGGQTDIVTDAVGETAPPADTGGLAAALAMVASGYDAYHDATEGYVKRNFRAEQMVERYESLYREVTHGERATNALRTD